ncbi:molybdopterin converting factor subunit 1 [Chitinophaga defluvii]|uniref:Molybdopterin synthase sulfur carrier subunit n=1 Tax=Chitinophaga defluvii TaxID=3163343 RepID=A0ABV2T9T6_9BACT
MKVLLFGIVKDIVTAPVITVTEDITTVGDLKHWLFRQYPALQNLRSLMIAVNSAYAGNEQVLIPGDEVAVIPPVSGG